MFNRPRMLLASGALLVASFTTMATATASSADVPEKFSSVVAKGAYAVAWIPDVDEVLGDAKRIVPPIGDIPSSMKQLLTAVFSMDPSVTPGKSLIFWVTPGPTMGSRPGDPLIHFAISAPGANAQNTHAGNDTTLFFENDMVIAMQGVGQSWKMPASSSRLIPLLSNDPVSIAVNIKDIWGDQGQQIQMLGGFGAMAAQMAMMDQNQSNDPKEQTRIREEQKKVGEVMRSSMNGIFKLLRTMDTMTMGLRMDGDIVTVSNNFNFMEAVGSGPGADLALVNRLKGGMPIYAAMNAQMTQWALNLEYSLEDALMTGLSKEQHAALDAIIPMMRDLNDTITGGLAMSMDINEESLHETVELKVQDSSEFIKGMELMMKQIDNVDLGWNSTRKSADTWHIDIDAQKLASSMNRPQMGMLADTPFLNNGMNLQMIGDGKFVTMHATMGTGADLKGTNDTMVRDYLKKTDGQDLVFGLAMDAKQLLMAAREMLNPNGKNPQTDNMPDLLFAVVGTAKAEQFRINLHLDMPGINKFMESMQN